ncbi:MAG: LPP20 family lipoprotein [Treponema sp.]|nr:LPP20 family lipoprotein [Treponema sp.]
MKKFGLVLLVIATVLLVFGCKSKPDTLETDINIPDFVANPPVSDIYLYGVGNAKFSTNSSQAMQAADARARTDLATKLNTEVQSMIIDYARIAGTENNSTATLSFYESISQQLTSATLRGVELVERDRTTDGTYWSLVRMSKSDAAAFSAEIIDSEASRYAEFKAMEALKLMQDQLNKK